MHPGNPPGILRVQEYDVNPIGYATGVIGLVAALVVIVVVGLIYFLLCGLCNWARCTVVGAAIALIVILILLLIGGAGLVPNWLLSVIFAAVLLVVAIAILRSRRCR